MKKLLLTLILFVLGTNLSFAQKENDPEMPCGTRNMTDQEKQTLFCCGSTDLLYNFSYISKKIKQSMKQLYQLIFSFLYFNFIHFNFLMQ